MNLYIWRHSNRFSSWSMLDELPIHEDNYSRAEVIVVATSRKEALELLAQQGKWNIEALEQIEPMILTMDQPRILTSHFE